MAEPNELVEHFFRHEYANLVSVLTRAFGIRRIDLIEDMVGAAMVQAMNSWKRQGVPDNPSAWIHRVARNRILDYLRRENVHDQAIGLLSMTFPVAENPGDVIDEWLEPESLPDSLLRMMFVCCHPELDQVSQIALTLKLVCGFGIDEISVGILLKKETVKKKIQRAKKKLEKANVAVDFPLPEAALARLASVHNVLYLLFNEGYSTTRGDAPIREDLCEEAVRLCLMLCHHSNFSTGESKALLSLMLFHASRLESRTDSLGNNVLLENQDRTAWDRELMQTANRWLVSSVQKVPSRFHLEAVIAATHCAAEKFEETDWETIIKFYQKLIELYPSPIYELNCAVAYAQTGEFEKSNVILNGIRQDQELEDYCLLDCAEAFLLEKMGDKQGAVDKYLEVMSKPISNHRKLLIEKRLSDLAKRE